MDFVLRMMDITKTFDQTVVLQNISLMVKEGTICGLIGADGAGKSTLLRIACGLLSADEGEVTILNFDLPKHSSHIREIVGYMPQKFSLYQDLTVQENIRFFAEMFRVEPRKRTLLEQKLYKFSKLEPFKNRYAGALSGGMKQKLALTCTLMNEPKLLLLDEPTYGVDPVSRQELWEILFELKENGTAILVATPYMDEAEKCDWIYGLHKGKQIFSGTKDQILSQFQQTVFRIEDPEAKFDTIFELKNQIEKFHEVQYALQFGNAVHIIAQKEILSPQFYAFINQNNLICKEIKAGIAELFLVRIPRS